MCKLSHSDLDDSIHVIKNVAKALKEKEDMLTTFFLESLFCNLLNSPCTLFFKGLLCKRCGKLNSNSNNGNEVGMNTYKRTCRLTQNNS